MLVLIVRLARSQLYQLVLPLVKFYLLIRLLTIMGLPMQSYSAFSSSIRFRLTFKRDDAEIVAVKERKHVTMHIEHQYTTGISECCERQFLFHVFAQRKAILTIVFYVHITIIKVPANSSNEPIRVFQVNASPRKITANSIVRTRLHLSMGTTFDTSPTFIA